ncbi:hypothetical protein ES703_70661 [subsurface metagenome]
MKQKKPRIRKSRKEPTRERKPGNPPQITGFWGRGASPYRPGIFTKRYLEENGEGCASDVFHALKDDLRRINKERVEIGDRPIRGGTYNSYAKFWHWFKLAGLIEPTDRREPAIYDFLEERVFYRLTSKGEAEVRAWEDPVRAVHLEFD